MTDWLVLLTPLLVLPIILLFRFVGCGLDAIGTLQDDPVSPFGPPAPPFSHAGEILKHPDLVSYWRLGEADGEAPMKDEKGTRNGVYPLSPALSLIPPVPPAPPDPNTLRSPTGSEAAPGAYEFGQPGLITFDPGTSVRFLGGIGEVWWLPALHPPAFTIEAWVVPEWDYAGGVNSRGFDHVLMETHEVVGGQPRGFKIYANQFDRWQVGLYRISAPFYDELFPTTPSAGKGVNLHVKTHIAVTHDHVFPGTLRLYLDGEIAGEKTTLYSRAQGTGTLYLGAGAPKPEPGFPEGRRYPFLGRVQEVALYNTALPGNVIHDHYKMNPKPV